MVIIRFADAQTERRALGFMAGRFPFKSWETGETAVAESTLAYLAGEGFVFTVEGPATYERLASLRNPAPAPVQ
jgi:hypothetical protein